MRSSLAPGKSATPPARCIHRPQRDTSSAEYRLLVSRTSGISPERSEPRKRSLEVCASRELSSRRSPALIPHTCAVSPTFLYGAFSFVVFALADLLSARLAIYGNRSNRPFTTVLWRLSPWLSITNLTCKHTRHAHSHRYIYSISLPCEYTPKSYLLLAE